MTAVWQIVKNWPKITHNFSKYKYLNLVSFFRRSLPRLKRPEEKSSVLWLLPRRLRRTFQKVRPLKTPPAAPGCPPPSNPHPKTSPLPLPDPHRAQASQKILLTLTVWFNPPQPFLLPKKIPCWILLISMSLRLHPPQNSIPLTPLPLFPNIPKTY